MSAADSKATAETIGVLNDGLRLIELLAADFEPRNLSQIMDLAESEGYTWSRTKTYNMLVTFREGGWLRRDASDRWSLSPHWAAIAVSYHESIIARAGRFLGDVDAVKKITEERITNAG
jgi:DNA-binding IclR family transcriptional regulator